MISVESDCYDCDLPCIYESCPHYKVVRYICDCCYDEVDNLYYFDGQELCTDCIEQKLERVEYDD
jgi:hypothetical protein